MAMNRDPLRDLAFCRQALLANKTRDFAAERPERQWPAESFYAPSLRDCSPVRMVSRHDYNEDRRARERQHTLWPRYERARLRAMRPCSRLALTTVLATNLYTPQSRALLIEWRQQVAA